MLSKENLISGTEVVTNSNDVENIIIKIKGGLGHLFLYT